MIRIRWGLLLLTFALLCGCSSAVLYNQVDEQQANEMMGTLLAAGIPAEKHPSDAKTGWAVSVPRSEFPHAVELLRARGLPRQRHQTLGEVFEKEGFASSPLEEKARYLHALSQELSYTLSQLDGVIEARVHIALPDRDPLGREGRESSASVVIVERTGANLRSRETDIKAIIKDSVEGLNDINKVTVKFFTGAEPPPRVTAAIAADRPGLAGAGSWPYALSLLLLGGAVAGWRWRHGRSA